ncbi:MAG TPA: type II secretion system protein [Planctomycetes bacterium]|nr:type II secretion system protein [Planctomycetota bacterium]HIJ70994.1 type II secretion system protein [Planctomycetota bacterium]
MKAGDENLNKCSGFTIIELLTVMGIIAILIGLLVPALNLVKDYTKELEQKAQFHSIDAALGMFSAEDRYGRYPESNDNMDLLDPTKDNQYDIPLGVPYCGANKLAEAIVGLDFLGFHPNSDFRSNNTFSHPEPDEPLGMYHEAPTYHADTNYEPDNPLYVESAEENVKARWGPFVELENANAFMVTDIYDADAIEGPGIGDFDPDRANLVLCDVFDKKRHAGKKTGMPILYYKARTKFTQQDYRPDMQGKTIHNDIYYYMDNYNLLALGSAETPGDWHPLANGLPGDGGDISAGAPDYTSEDDWRDFENMILNPQIATIKRPYRAGSYILMSAGKDGLYGTPDDIFNFDKE